MCLVLRNVCPYLPGRGDTMIYHECESRPPNEAIRRKATLAFHCGMSRCHEVCTPKSKEAFFNALKCTLSDPERLSSSSGSRETF